MCEVKWLDNNLDYGVEAGIYVRYPSVSLDSAEEKYKELLRLVNYIPDLSEDEREKLKALLELRVSEFPKKREEVTKHHEEILQKIEQEKKLRKEAWDSAKKRFKSQSIFKKAKDYWNRETPKIMEHQLSMRTTTVDEINRLYREDHER